MSFYLRSGSTKEDVEAVINYMTVLTNMEHLNEVTEVIKHLIESQAQDTDELIVRLAGKKQ